MRAESISNKHTHKNRLNKQARWSVRITQFNNPNIGVLSNEWTMENVGFLTIQAMQTRTTTHTF